MLQVDTCTSLNSTHSVKSSNFCVFNFSQFPYYKVCPYFCICYFRFSYFEQTQSTAPETVFFNIAKKVQNS